MIGICLIISGLVGFMISWEDNTTIQTSKMILFLVYLFAFLSLIFGSCCILRECTSDGIITQYIKLHNSESVEEKTENSIMNVNAGVINLHDQ